MLTPQLRSGAPIHHKWKQQSEIGIYLGTSPVHHRNVALILNPQTGLVSPKFHVRFDPEFTTVPDHTERSLWQSLAGFVRGTQTFRLDRQKRCNQTEELSLQQLPPSDLAPNPHHQEEETNTSSADVPNTKAPITNQDSDLPINIPPPY